MLSFSTIPSKSNLSTFSSYSTRLTFFKHQ